MPGIFFSCVQEVFPKAFEERKPLPPSNKGKKKRLYFILAFLCLSLLIMHSWKSSATQLVGLPAKHRDFAGREEELKILKKRLLVKRRERGLNLVALCGEGGIGKTELAIAFANEQKKGFSLIGWVDGSCEEALAYSYARLGDVLGIHEPHPGALRAKVHRALSHYGKKPWLLIFDDLREVPQDFPTSGGAVLMTCRDKSLNEPEAVIELQKKPKEAVQLLAKLTGEKESESLKQLASQLDYLPFMMNLIGHYIAETPDVTISDFSKRIDTLLSGENGPLQKCEFRKRYPRSLAATYLITLEILKKKEPLCVEFLKHAAYLHPKNIPLEYLCCWLGQQALVKGDILRELQNHSLAQIDLKAKDLTLHHLLHRVLKTELKEEGYALKSAHILSKLDCVTHYNPTQKDTIRPFQKVIPHCAAILNHLPDGDLTAARLSLILARYFLDTERHLEKAEQSLSLAKKWSEHWDHPINGRIAFLYGLLRYREKKHEQALEFFEQALTIFQEHDRNELYEAIEQNPSKCTKEYQRAISLQYCAQVKGAIGHFEEAEKGYERALCAFEDLAKGAEHFDIARILREQGIILAKRGQCEAAIEKIQAAIEMQKRVYGQSYSSQPTAAATYQTLGDLFLQSQRFKESDQAYEKAIKISQEIYQIPIHPYLARLYQRRAEVLRAQGKNFLAKKMESKSEQIKNSLARE